MNVILLEKKFKRRIEQKKEREEVKNANKEIVQDIFSFPKNFLTVFKKLKIKKKKNQQKIQSKKS